MTPPPNSSGYNGISFLFSWAAQPGAWGPRLCWNMVLIPASSLQLIWNSCRRGYIIIWRPPTSCKRHISTQFNPLTVKVIPWFPAIFGRMHLFFTQVHFFFWQLGRSQHATTIKKPFVDKVLWYFIRLVPLHLSNLDRWDVVKVSMGFKEKEWHHVCSLGNA